MSEKVVVIISTAETEKARTGAMYAVNALKHGRLEEARLLFFGPAEQLVLTDTFPARDATHNHVERSLRFLASTADRYEKVLFGTDHH